MKTKYFKIMNRMLLILLLLAGTPQMAEDTGVFAQGIYSRNAAASENERENEKETGQANGNDDRGGLFRAGGKENPTDGGQASKISPVKDGWSVVIVAAIGYGCFVARRKRE